MTTSSPGVTLQPIDGGPNYYSVNGFTNAVNKGWDNPNFIPIGPWLAPMHSQADAARWADLGWNTAYAFTADSNMSLFQGNGISAIVNSQELSQILANNGGSLGPETVGLLTMDEPPTYSDALSAIQNTANSIQGHNFWWGNYTWGALYQDGQLPGTPAPGDQATVLDAVVHTPNGTTAHVDLQSVDLYWFAGAHASFWQQVGGMLYNLGHDMTPDQMARGSNYGDMIDVERSYQAGHFPAPITAYIEDGGPAAEDTSAADYITPPELNWAVWSSLIHGAQNIVYFNHTFAGPAQSDDNMAQPYYQTIQPGQTISMYNQIKATDAEVEQMAPILHAPNALNYVSTPGGYEFGTSGIDLTQGGIEAAAHLYNGNYYIFADTRDSMSQTNISATFTLNDPNATSVTVFNESRTIPVVNGSFSDTFATAATVHIYQVTEASDTMIPAIAVEGSMYGAVGSSAEITSLATVFLPPQIAYATQHGFNPVVFASEALGLAFAFGNENGSSAFANAFGPGNVSMPNSPTGDAAFAAAAASTIFGAASTANLIDAIDGFVANWKTFYTTNGIPGTAHASAAQIDVAARGAAWGDAVGVALANNIGPLLAQATNFLQDVAQGTADYSAPLTSQPHSGISQGTTSFTASAAGDPSVQLIGVAPHTDPAL